MANKAKTGLILVECYMCGGSGQQGEWDNVGKKEMWVVEDCQNCDGKGKSHMPFLDKRSKPSFKTMLRPRHF